MVLANWLLRVQLVATSLLSIQQQSPGSGTRQWARDRLILEGYSCQITLANVPGDSPQT